MAHFAIGLKAGGEICDEDWDEGCEETKATVSVVEIVPI